MASIGDDTPRSEYPTAQRVERRERGTGGVHYERERDRWVGTVHLGTNTDGSRIKRRVTAKTKATAIARLRELRRDAAPGSPTAHRSMTVGELLERWLDKAAATRVENRATIANYERIADLIRGQIGNVKLTQLGPDHVERVFAYLASSGYAKTTIQRCRNVLSQSLRWGVRRRYAAWDPCAVAELPADDAIDSQRTRASRSLTPEQARALVVAARNHRNGAALVLALTVGLRPGEVTALTWADLDEETVSLAIPRAWKDAGEHRRLGDPKTRRSIRTVAVPSTVMVDLAEHRRRQRAEALALGWRDELGLMFVSEAGTPIDPANLRRLVRNVAKEAGVGHVTPYMLRHTAASLLVDAQTPIERVSDLLGHADSRTTERYYTHRVRPAIDTAVAPMDALLGVTSETS
jgi:integrase